MLERLVLVVFLGLSFPAIAQNQNAIHVVGSGELLVEPDIAMFNFGIQGQTDSPRLAKERADAISGDLVRRLESLGVDSSDIRSTPVTLFPFQDLQTQRELVRFNRTTSVTLRDVSKFEDVESAALEAGVNAIGDVQFGVSNEIELQDRARDLALDDARSQAEGIARNIDAQLGRVLSVTVNRPRRVISQVSRALEVSAASAAEHRSGLVVISQDVSIAYEILQP